MVPPPANTFPCGLNFLVAFQQLAHWWLNLDISLCWLGWPSSVASCGRSDSRPCTDLMDNINISWTTKHFMPKCFTSQSQMVGCQCSQCRKSAWVVNSLELILKLVSDKLITSFQLVIQFISIQALFQTHNRVHSQVCLQVYYSIKQLM